MRMSSVTIEEEPMPQIPRGDTRRFQITVRDGNGKLADPDWVKLNFRKPVFPGGNNGPFSATRASEGIYFLDYAFPGDTFLGEWVREWTWGFQIAGKNYPGRYQSPLEIIDLTEGFDTFE